MNPQVLPSILLLISAAHAFQYMELAQYVDSHQDEYVEVQISAPYSSGTELWMLELL